MANDYFNASGYPATGSRGVSQTLRTELAAVQAGFDKLPTLGTAAGKRVAVNNSGTGMVATPLTAAEVQTAIAGGAEDMVLPRGLSAGGALYGRNIVCNGVSNSAGLGVYAGAGNGGVLVLARGAGVSGNAFVRLFLVAIAPAGGTGAIAATQVSGIGDSIPGITFTLGALNEVIANVGSGNLCTFSVIGG